MAVTKVVMNCGAAEAIAARAWGESESKEITAGVVAHYLALAVPCFRLMRKYHPANDVRKITSIVVAGGVGHYASILILGTAFCGAWARRINEGRPLKL